MNSPLYRLIVFCFSLIPCFPTAQAKDPELILINKAATSARLSELSKKIISLQRKIENAQKQISNNSERLNAEHARLASEVASVTILNQYENMMVRWYKSHVSVFGKSINATDPSYALTQGKATMRSPGPHDEIMQKYITLVKIVRGSEGQIEAFTEQGKILSSQYQYEVQKIIFNNDPREVKFVSMDQNPASNDAWTAAGLITDAPAWKPGERRMPTTDGRSIHIFDPTGKGPETALFLATEKLWQQKEKLDLMKKKLKRRADQTVKIEPKQISSKKSAYRTKSRFIKRYRR